MSIHHVIRMTPKYDGKSLHTDVEIRVHSRYIGREINLGIGAVPEGVEHRRVQNGPLHTEKWAFTYPLATVIAASTTLIGAFVLHVRLGDTFEIDGAVYVLTDDRPHHYPALTPVDGLYARATIERPAPADWVETDPREVGPSLHAQDTWLVGLNSPVTRMVSHFDRETMLRVWGSDARPWMVELLVDGEPEDDTYFATRADVERFLASAGA